MYCGFCYKEIKTGMYLRRTRIDGVPMSITICYDCKKKTEPKNDD